MIFGCRDSRGEQLEVLGIHHEQTCVSAIIMQLLVISNIMRNYDSL